MKQYSRPELDYSYSSIPTHKVSLRHSVCTHVSSSTIKVATMEKTPSVKTEVTQTKIRLEYHQNKNVTHTQSSLCLPQISKGNWCLDQAVSLCILKWMTGGKTKERSAAEKHFLWRHNEWTIDFIHPDSNIWKYAQNMAQECALWMWDQAKLQKHWRTSHTYIYYSLLCKVWEALYHKPEGSLEH